MPMVYTPIGACSNAPPRGGTPVADPRLHRHRTRPRRRAARARPARSSAISPRARASGIDGMMMTFTEDQAFDREQLTRFDALAAELDTGGVAPGAGMPPRATRCSSIHDAFLDMVRPGMALYGIYPEPEFRTDRRARPAAGARAQGARRLRQAARRPARAPATTAPTWRKRRHVDRDAAGRPRRRLPRVAAKGGARPHRRRLYPVIASVSASHTIVEIGPERASRSATSRRCSTGRGSRPEDVAAACGASVYDLTMHLNPLLPRRVVGG